MNRELILIGYWHDEHNNWPDPAWFVDEFWNNEEKQRVVAHMRNAKQMPYAAGGHSWCRFRCTANGLGNTEFTDGKYLWPEGLLHYIEYHHVKLPQVVVDDFLSTKENDFDANGEYNINSEWWQQQKGWNKNAQSFKTQPLAPIKKTKPPFSLE